MWGGRPATSAAARAPRNHHSIVGFKGKWYIFYHDTQLSNKTWLRNVKVTELKRNADGSIATSTP